MDKTDVWVLKHLAANLVKELKPYGFLTRLKQDEGRLAEVLEDALELANHIERLSTCGRL